MDFKRARNDDQVEIRRQEILDACKELLETNGYDSTTLLSVSKLISVGRTTIYNYFPTKEDMFLELCTNEAMSLIDDIKEAYKNTSKETAEKDFYDMLVMIFVKYKHLLKYYAIYISKVFDKATEENIEFFSDNVTTPFKNYYKKWLLLINPKLSNEDIKVFNSMLFVFFIGINNVTKDDNLYKSLYEEFAKATIMMLKK